MGIRRNKFFFFFLHRSKNIKKERSESFAIDDSMASSSSEEQKPEDQFTQAVSPPQVTVKECVHKTKLVEFLGRTTPIVLQNDNGPCPLLAICKVSLCLSLTVFLGFVVLSESFSSSLRGSLLGGSEIRRFWQALRFFIGIQERIVWDSVLG